VPTAPLKKQLSYR